MDTAVDSSFDFSKPFSMEQDQFKTGPLPEMAPGPKVTTSVKDQFLGDLASRKFELPKFAGSFTEGVNKFVVEIFKTISHILVQAVKMAVFKFAIEFCAMTIKNLVETMTKMSLTPPNIDTKGVFYNFSGNTSTTTASSSGTSTSSPSRYGNPFGDPFGTSPSW